MIALLCRTLFFVGCVVIGLSLTARSATALPVVDTFERADLGSNWAMLSPPAAGGNLVIVGGSDVTTDTFPTVAVAGWSGETLRADDHFSYICTSGVMPSTGVLELEATLAVQLASPQTYVGCALGFDETGAVTGVTGTFWSIEWFGPTNGGQATPFAWVPMNCIGIERSGPSTFRCYVSADAETWLPLGDVITVAGFPNPGLPGMGMARTQATDTVTIESWGAGDGALSSEAEMMPFFDAETATPTGVATSTATPTRTGTHTPTSTPTRTPTVTPTPSFTFIPTCVPVSTPTTFPTTTATATFAGGPTWTPTPLPILVATIQPERALITDAAMTTLMGGSGTTIGSDGPIAILSINSTEQYVYISAGTNTDSAAGIFGNVYRLRMNKDWTNVVMDPPNRVLGPSRLDDPATLTFDYDYAAGGQIFTCPSGAIGYVYHGETGTDAAYYHHMATAEGWSGVGLAHWDNALNKFVRDGQILGIHRSNAWCGSGPAATTLQLKSAVGGAALVDAPDGYLYLYANDRVENGEEYDLDAWHCRSVSCVVVARALKTDVCAALGAGPGAQPMWKKFWHDTWTQDAVLPDGTGGLFTPPFSPYINSNPNTFAAGFDGGVKGATKVNDVWLLASKIAQTLTVGVRTSLDGLHWSEEQIVLPIPTPGVYPSPGVTPRPDYPAFYPALSGTPGNQDLIFTRYGYSWSAFKALDALELGIVPTPTATPTATPTPSMTPISGCWGVSNALIVPASGGGYYVIWDSCNFDAAILFVNATPVQTWLRADVTPTPMPPPTPDICEPDGWIVQSNLVNEGDVAWIEVCGSAPTAAPTATETATATPTLTPTRTATPTSQPASSTPTASFTRTPTPSGDICTTITPAVTADDGWVERTGLVWPLSYLDPGASSTTSALIAAANKEGVAFRSRQVLLRFNTAGLPDDAIIRRLYFEGDLSAITDTDGQTLRLAWYPANQWPIGDEDYFVGAGSDAFAGIPLSNLTTGTISLLLTEQPGAVDLTASTGLRLHVDEPSQPTGLNQLTLTNEALKICYVMPTPTPTALPTPSFTPRPGCCSPSDPITAS